MYISDEGPFITNVLGDSPIVGFVAFIDFVAILSVYIILHEF